MKRPTLLAIDLSNQLYRVCAAYPTLTSKGAYTGGLYGFVMAVQKALLDCEADRVVVCRDSKPYLRAETYPEYKALRQGKKDPELAERVALTVPLIHELLSVLGWPLWAVEGFESDDLIAYCMTQHRHRYSRVIAMSNDSDLYQLFRWPQFAVYKGGKKGLYVHKHFATEWGIPPERMPLLLAMTGTHNEIAGIDDIGPVRARQLLLNPDQYRKLRQTHGKLIDRNVGLIQLPHPEFPLREKIPRLKHPFAQRQLVLFCARYDIRITLRACDAFAQITG